MSMIGDHYHDKWTDRKSAEDLFPSPVKRNEYILIPSPVTREEFEKLKAEVAEMKALLLKAKKYDEDNGEPGCEMESKVEVLKRVAEMVGVDLSEIFTKE
jgi:hypothetical protein